LISSSFSSSSIHNNCFRTLITVFAMISSLTYTQVIRWVVITSSKFTRWTWAGGEKLKQIIIFQSTCTNKSTRDINTSTSTTAMFRDH
jgi:hypothetical protein